MSFVCGRSGDGSVLSPRSRLLPPPVSFTVPASPPQSPTRLRVVASPRKTANRSHKPTPDVSLYSRPGEYAFDACVHIVSLVVKAKKNSNEHK